MNELSNSFTQLLGRQPSDAEKQALYRAKDALGIKNNDALWQVLIALQFYQTQYEKMPAEIARAADEVTASVRAAAQAEAHAAMQTVKAELIKAVANSANKVADQVAGKVKTQWKVACVVVVTVCLGGTGWLAYQAGDKHGWGRGHQKMLVEEAAAEWSFTPEGLAAYELSLAGAGTIKSLADCKGVGWHREKYEDGFACWPRADKKGKQPTGWRVP